MSFFGENKFLYIQRIYNVFRFKPYMIVIMNLNFDRAVLRNVLTFGVYKVVCSYEC